MIKRRSVCGFVGVVLLAAGCSSSTGATSSGATHQPSPPVLSAASASAGCKLPSAPKVTAARLSLTVSGGSRDYLLTTPPPQHKPAPLVVDFHGYGEGDLTESLTTQFGQLGQRDGFVVLFPQGTGQPIAWNTSTRSDNPDLHFIRSLLNHIEATQCIDRSRVYATGLSQGAFMTSAVACAMSGRFAAVAPVDGVQLPKPCHTTRPVPMLAFHGTADPILHFNGGIGRQVLANDLKAKAHGFPKLPPPRLNGPGYPATVKAWAAKNGCGKRPTDTKVSPHVIHRVYPCPKRTAVEFDIIIGGGHSWPGSAFSREIVRFVGHTTTEINATDAIWSFFQRFRSA
jgi:polyhydroxybutyrate depolymerase